MQDEILDANQVAEMLHVKYRTVVRLADRRELPDFKVGDLWRFRRADIDKYIDEQLNKRGRARNE